MSENSYLSNALYAAGDKAEYDAGAKKVLADKQVLAWILKYCVKRWVALRDIDIILSERITSHAGISPTKRSTTVNGTAANLNIR